LFRWGLRSDVAAAGFDVEVVAIDFDLEAVIGAVSFHLVKRHPPKAPLLPHPPHLL